MKKAMIFDLDGTLLDTIEDIADSLNVILVRRGLVPLPVETVKTYVGNGLAMLLQRSLADPVQSSKKVSKEEQQAMLQELIDYYSGHCLIKTKPYPHILETLKELKKQGVKTAIVTNKNIRAAKELKDLVFAEQITVVVGEDEAHGIRKKPAPDMVQMAADQLGVALQEAYYVGDSEVDVQTAQNAGMEGLFVLWGFRSRQQLLEAGAKILIEKPEDLLLQ
ncbi:MAG: HAD family hydrolase [Lachnospiraceae bacterium]